MIKSPKNLWLETLSGGVAFHECQYTQSIHDGTDRPANTEGTVIAADGTAMTSPQHVHNKSNAYNNSMTSCTMNL